MLVAVEEGLVDVAGEVAPLGGDAGLGHPPDQLLGLAAVADEVGDADQQQPVGVGEALQLGEAGHLRLVLGDDLAQHAGRVQPGHPGQVDGGLGVAAALEHAAVPVPQREDVAGPGQVGGPGVGVDEGGDGGGPVGGRDPGGGDVAGVDRDGERGAVGLGVVDHHRRQLELVEALAEHRHADHARRVAQEEGDPLGRGVLGGDDEVALVLPAGVVDDDDDLASAEGGHRLLDRGERHGFSPRCRSRLTDLLHVLGDQVELQVDTVAGPAGPQGGDLGGVGDDGHREPVVGQVNHREADAVDRDRPLLHHVAGRRRPRSARSGRGSTPRRRRRRGPAPGGRRGGRRGAAAARG